MTDLEQRLREAKAEPYDRKALAAGLAERAATAGLLDVAYAELDSPIGELIVFINARSMRQYRVREIIEAGPQTQRPKPALRT